MSRPKPRPLHRKPGIWSAVALLATAVAPVSAHDMFLVLPSHHLPSHTAVTVALYNGTFSESLNIIDRARMVDVSIVDGAGKVSHPPASSWSEQGKQTLLTLETGLPGTYLVGVSTAPNVIELSAEEFNEYLEHDGVVDTLEQRRRAGRLDLPVRERYAKHVKTVLQVGDILTDYYTQLLGYPVEIVPQINPGILRVGDRLRLLVLADGAPAPGQLLYAGDEGHTTASTGDSHREPISARTDSRGLAEIEISRPGRWYVRLIRMVEVIDGDVDYESNWATLTFEVVD